jgi:hypothetical protein
VFDFRQAQGSSRDRSAVSPFPLCLSGQGCWQDRSDDRATLDGLKRFRLLSGLVWRPCPLWSFIARNASGQGDPDAPTGVSGHRVSAVPHTRRLRDASDFASILRFRGIYGRHRSQEPVGAATDCIVATDLMILKGCPWRPAGSARPRPLLLVDLGPRFSSILCS